MKAEADDAKKKQKALSDKIRQIEKGQEGKGEGPEEGLHCQVRSFKSSGE